MRPRRSREPSIARRTGVRATALVLSLLAASSSAAQPAVPAALPARIEALVSEAKLPPQLSLSVVDLETGRDVVAINAQTPRNPASNLKLLTAAAALLVLGPDFRMQTGLYGYVRQERTEALCLKGHADPTLSRAQLVELAQRLRDRGVREVDQLTIDGSYLDGEILPPAFEQQPNETAPFRAAVGAVSVNANAYTLRVGPGVGLGAPARVSVDGAGYFKIDNRVTTTNAAVPNVAIEERDLGDSVSLTLTGNVPLTGATLALPRRVASPLHFAGHIFLDVLTMAGIRAPNKVAIGTCRPDAGLLARLESEPVAEMISKLGKNSDNFVAEMLVKIMAAERTRKPGSTSAGIGVVQDALRRLHLPVANNVHMINGSGLFQGNLVTTELFSQTLVAMWNDPSLHPEYVAHLAVGGADGTLARRFSQLTPARIVRAKTGTLNDVIALSGYVLGPKPGRAYAFSFLANGIKGKQGTARALVDKVVETLAADLHSQH
jgi:D-alanyl-D-alanine carboxypeptidase/D-alanyl-D-alanine-endopeptidase (penicillin-binding protein 4)